MAGPLPKSSGHGELEPSANLIFIHRDADSRDPSPRHEEVAAAFDGQPHQAAWVAIVPVQETEAWLLLDEAAIRRVAGKPSGRAQLKLPQPSEVESKAEPKELLQQALRDAAEVTGRRLKRLNAEFSANRRLLLERLPIGGPLEQVNAWARLRDDVKAAIAKVCEA